MSKNVQDYFDELPEHRSRILARIHDHILSLFPDVRVSVKNRMPTYEAGDRWLAIASQKRYVSVYTCRREIIQPYLDKHPDIDAGVGCLRFRDRQEIHLLDLEIVIRRALGQDKQR